MITAPTDIAGCQLWLDMDDGASITQSGGLASQINDKSGNARHFTQGSGANQPAVTAAAINGRTALTFAFGKEMNAAGVGISQPFTIAAVFKATSNATPARVFDSDSVGRALLNPSAGFFGAYAGAVLDGPGASDTAVHYEVAIFTSSTDFVRLDGAEIVNGNVGGNQTGSAWHLGWDNGSDFMTGHVTCVVIYDSEIAGADLTDLEAYLNAIAFGGGGTAYTASPADAEGLVDAMAQVMLDVRSFSDAEGLLDSRVQFEAAVRTFSDSLGETDAASSVQSAARLPADAVGLLDAATQAGVDARTQSDPSGLLDSAAQSAAYVQSPADAQGLVDAMAQAPFIAANPDDPLGLTDAESQAAVSVRSPADPVGLSDASSQAAAAAQAPSDAVGLTDITAQVVAYARTALDALGILDAALQSSAANQTAADAAGLTDLVAQAGVYARALSENLGALDDSSQGNFLTQSSGDALGILDAVASNAAYVRLLADPEALVDAMTQDLVAGGVFTQTVTDPTGLTDATSQASASARAVLDVLVALDIAVGIIIGPATVTYDPVVVWGIATGRLHAVDADFWQAKVTGVQARYWFDIITQSTPVLRRRFPHDQVVSTLDHYVTDEG